MFYDLLWNGLTGHFHSLSQAAPAPGLLSLPLCPLWMNWTLCCVRCLHLQALLCRPGLWLGEEGSITDEEYFKYS